MLRLVIDKVLDSLTWEKKLFAYKKQQRERNGERKESAQDVDLKLSIKPGATQNNC